MIRQKLLMTLRWSAVSIAGAMLADYVITVLVLHDRAHYTPLATLLIATVVTIPVTYQIAKAHYNLARARDALAEARDAALRADRTKTQFFANMSHELRTPLNAILGFSELLGLDVFAPRRREYAKLIHDAGAHLLSLVNDLLDLSRIEAGKLELRIAPIDIGVLIEDCVETVGLRARGRDLRLAMNVERELPQVLADSRAIKQVLLNLLVNAIKFSHTGGEVEAFARLTPQGDLAFGVRDQGAGIPEDQQAHVFERFGQARDRIEGPEKGAGLGLPIVKGLAEAHGGRIALESAPGKGTCVTVTLPKDRLAPRRPIALAS
jgi:two-component system cell cycle sensor histidine kinase PleC